MITRKSSVRHAQMTREAIDLSDKQAHAEISKTHQTFNDFKALYTGATYMYHESLLNRLFKSDGSGIKDSALLTGEDLRNMMELGLALSKELDEQRESSL